MALLGVVVAIAVLAIETSATTPRSSAEIEVHAFGTILAGLVAWAAALLGPLSAWLRIVVALAGVASAGFGVLYLLALVSMF